jgi:hypothetical protein
MKKINFLYIAIAVLGIIILLSITKVSTTDIKNFIPSKNDNSQNQNNGLVNQNDDNTNKNSGSQDKEVKTPTRTTDAKPVETPAVKTVDVPIQRTQSYEKVVLNNYEDPNYPFEVTFPDGYSYDVTETAVFFKSKERSMFFTSEVIFTYNRGGLFNDIENVKDDYIGQLENYGPSIILEESKKINGVDSLVFDVRYTIDGRGGYINSFVVGKDEDYFYVLQFLTPESEFDSEKILIYEIINDYKFGN